MNGKKMTRNRVAEPVKEESMWTGRAVAEVLSAVLVIVMVAGSGVGSAAAQGKGKGKKPKAPVTPFKVEYCAAQSCLDVLGYLPALNILPDFEGLFGGSDSGFGCSPDCYVDGINGFTIEAQDGEWRQVHSPDLDLPDSFGDGRVYYRYFETDIESQVIEGGLCPELIDLDTGWTLGGSYFPPGDLPADRVVRFSLWVDDWPAAGENYIQATARAYVKGLIPVEDDVTGNVIEGDWDNDGPPEVVLDIINPGWDLLWNPQEYVDSSYLQITRIGVGEDFLIESTGQAMVRITRPGGRGQRRDCGLVDARFAFVATSIGE